MVENSPSSFGTEIIDTEVASTEAIETVEEEAPDVQADFDTENIIKTETEIEAKKETKPVEKLVAFTGSDDEFAAADQHMLLRESHYVRDRINALVDGYFGDVHSA